MWALVPLFLAFFMADWLERESLLDYSARSVALSPTLDAMFFALSDPMRRGDPRAARRRPATLSELSGRAGLTINGIKKHVGILEVAELVVTEKVGRARECRLGPAKLAEVTEWVDGYRRAWESRLDRFGGFVERRARRR